MRQSLYLLYRGLIFAVVLFFIFPVGDDLQSQTANKELVLLGQKIYSEDYVKYKLNLHGRLHPDEHNFENISKNIRRFYIERGYLLVNTYLVKDNTRSLVIYIDEGRLNRIVFEGLNTLWTLYTRYQFELPHKIYNNYRINQQFEKIKKSRGVKDVQALLTPAKVYTKSLLQLDREVLIPYIGSAKMPFLNSPIQRYNLEIEFVSAPSSSSKKRRGMRYNLNLHYTKGFIPEAEYDHPSLLQDGDFFNAETKVGLYYGLDLSFASIPDLTFAELETTYNLKPKLNNYFTPRVRGYAYHSRSSRSDLGLLRYKYVSTDGTLEPGIALLKELRVYLGYGVEKVFMFNSETDEESDYKVYIQESVDLWNYVTTSIELNLLPFTFSSTEKREFNLRYSYYKSDTDYHRILFNGELGFEFPGHTIYSVNMQAQYFLKRPPFYHEPSVSSGQFRGFMGSSYHTRRLAQLGQEVQVSIYRDFLYVGVYGDLTVFEGSGYDLDGVKYGMVGGPTLHYIIMDQFEFGLYFGRDYLLPNRLSGNNLNFFIHQKW
ncbi:MAG TPA: hypothetical protein VKQ10_01980 [Spirochaetota bacterium]|nr:hypothetical protein [Spirochaetota bacterium]